MVRGVFFLFFVAVMTWWSLCWWDSAADENDKSSGFGEGSMSLNMSVGEFVIGEISVGSSIVVFEKQLGGKVSGCSF